jgi:RHS repeat-associated protein
LAFACNLHNRPVTVTRMGGGTETSQYAFNALEQLVQRRTNAPGGPAGTVHYLSRLDGELLAEADAASGKTLRDYIWLPQDDISPAADNDNEEGASAPPLPLALVTGASTTTPQLLMVHADHLGRPARLTDANRATVWAASYDPFGLPVSITGTAEQNLRFPGQYFLIETGLSYNWHRFYDPATGRYTQPDPLRFVDGPGVYGYATASPMMWVDPEGLHKGDKWYGYNNREFQRWFHRCWKQAGDPDATKEEIAEAYDEWINRGSPTGGKCFGSSEDQSQEDTQCGDSCQMTKSVVISGGIAYIVYRCIRMIPSVAFPPLWPTIPPNVALP